MTTITKTIEKVRTNGDFMRITAELRLDHPTLSDGFSVTADLWEKRGTLSGRSRSEAGRDIDAGGCMHEDVLHLAPRLKPLVEVHLADPDGVPMHAIANGWYFYSGADHSNGRDALTPRQRAARALHIPPEDLPEGMNKTEFEAFAESLRPRWAEQARVARELLESL